MITNPLESSGFLTKCCSQTEILSSDLVSCVTSPDSTSVKTSSWLPPRKVLSSSTLRPTGQFHLETGNFPEICHGSDYHSVTPQHFLTDGRATVVSPTGTGGYDVIAYSCMDRTITSQGEITDIALLVCDQHNTTKIAKVSRE